MGLSNFHFYVGTIPKRVSFIPHCIWALKLSRSIDKKKKKKKSMSSISAFSFHIQCINECDLYKSQILTLIIEWNNILINNFF